MDELINKMQLLINEDIERNQASSVITSYGHDWCYLSAEESYIFRIELESWPRLLSLWSAYHATLNICYYSWERVEAEMIFKSFLSANDWLKECTIEYDEFTRFGKLFGYSFRELKALYAKQEFYDIRHGNVTYIDEH